MAKKLISNINDSIGAWEGKSVLIVEDVVSNYFYLEAAIKKSGISITWARSGEQAIDLLQDGEHYDVILMDVQLSGVDGYEVTRRIKELKPNIPVIAQTAYAMVGEKEKSKLAGCDDYLSKPIRPAILLETMSKYL